MEQPEKPKKNSDWFTKLVAIGALYISILSLHFQMSDREMDKQIEAKKLFNESNDILANREGSPWLTIGIDNPLTALELERLTLAGRRVREGLTLNPDACRGMELMGIVLMRLGELDSAFTYAQRGIQKCPSPYKPYLLMSAILYRQGKIDECEKYLRLDVAQEPTDYVRYLNLAYHFEALGKDSIAKAYRDTCIILSSKKGIAPALWNDSVSK